MKSIKAKLISLVTIIIVIMSIANVVTGIWSGYYSINKNVEGDMKAMGEIVDITLSAEIQLLQDQATAIADECEKVQDGMEAQILQSIINKYNFSDIAIVNRQGIVFDNGGILQGEDFSKKDYVQAALEGKSSISTTEINTDGTVVMYACAKIPGNYGGILLATIDGMYFSDIIRDIVIGKTGNVFMIDNTGVMIANKRPELVKERQNFIANAKTDPSFEATAAVYTKMISGEKGVDRYAYETGTRICAFGTVSNSAGWAYGVVAPIKEMTASIIYTVIALVVSSLLFLAIGIVCIILLAKQFTDPIQKITTRMKTLAQGDLETEVVIHNSKDEIGVLTKSVSDTVETLKSYIVDIETVLREISEGNLTVTTTTEFKGQFVHIEKSMERILEALNGTFAEITQSANEVSNGSEQVACGAQALSQGTTEQASAVEELASTMNEISGHIAANAENAERASLKSKESAQQVAQGQEEMDKMIQAMTQISETSGEISKIIKTVEDIAFQTNILALNAAVEAARAGEAGKGFAVVADEVRNLAGKSAEAAKDTTALIEQSIQAVAHGSQIAEGTARALEQIVASTGETLEFVDRICEASKEQSDSISQVNQGLEQVAAVVHTNSATAEQSAASSEELSSQAETMRQLVNQFQLK